MEKALRVKRGVVFRMCTHQKLALTGLVGALVVLSVAASFTIAKAQTSPARPPLNADERRETDRFLDKQFRACGDSVFAYWDLSDWHFLDGKLVSRFDDGRHDPQRSVTLTEEKRFSYEFESSAISEAGHLNGIDWAAHLKIHEAAVRRRYRGDGSWKEWSKWEPPDIGGSLPSISLAKVSGKLVWRNVDGEFELAHMPSMPSCAALVTANPGLPSPDGQAIAKAVPKAK